MGGGLYRNDLLKGRKENGMIRNIEHVELSCRMERSLCVTERQLCPIPNFGVERAECQI